jgi:phosphate-selective porin OprO/OprP
MLHTKPAKWIVGTLLCGMAMPAVAQQDVQSEVAELRSRLAQLESQSWLNERRAEEVKTLIREVLADADTRASLMQEGVMAGVDDKGKVFLQSADGSFRMNVWGQVQFRYIFNIQDDDSRATPADDAGFQVRRVKLGFNGHVADPKLTYALVLATDRGDGNVFVEDIKVGYTFDNGLGLNFGKYKLPFLRQELQSSARQLAVERASVTEFFTLNRGEQVELTYTSDMIKGALSINDGSNTEFSDIGADPVEIGLTARADVKLAGDWKQFDDVSSWPGEDMGLVVGAAVHWQTPKSDRAPGDYFGWTVDGQFETNGLGILAAVMGGHIYDRNDGGDRRDMYGFLIEGGYHVSKELEPFVRYEFLDADDDGDNLHIVTLGANWYLRGHNAKWTTDLVLVLDGDNATNNPFGASEFSSGLGFTGFSSADDDIYIMLRSQFQLLF